MMQRYLQNRSLRDRREGTRFSVRRRDGRCIHGISHDDQPIMECSVSWMISIASVRTCSSRANSCSVNKKLGKESNDSLAAYILVVQQAHKLTRNMGSPSVTRPSPTGLLRSLSYRRAKAKSDVRSIASNARPISESSS